MRETDLAKSLPAARCEMDSGTVTGKAQSKEASVGPSRSPACLPVCPSREEPTSPTHHQHCGEPMVAATGNSGSGRTWVFCSASRTCHCCTSFSPSFCKARPSQAIPDKGAPSLSVSSPLLQQTHDGPRLPLLNPGKSLRSLLQQHLTQVQSQVVVALGSLLPELSLARAERTRAHSHRVQQYGFGGQRSC